MASKSKQVRERQKDYWVDRLNQRITILADKGIKTERITKDAEIRHLRAKIRQTGSRLKVISSMEKKAEERAKIKAERAARLKKQKGGKKVTL